MSVPAVMKDVQLVSDQLFDHVPVVHKHIEHFVENFERNERHREFDGIIRASHALVEASETNVEALFDDGRLTRMTSSVDQLAERIKKLTQPTYKEEHDQYLAAIAKSQKDYVDLCRTEAQKKMRSAAGAQCP